MDLEAFARTLCVYQENARNLTTMFAVVPDKVCSLWPTVRL